MKDLVANKQLTEEDDEVSMNPRCSALLQNQLPLIENDPRSFILPCSIGRLDFNNALADLGASIRIMPFPVFDLEIDQLADEYELGIRKKGHMLDKIWEYCKDVHRDNTYWWHKYGFEKDECDEMGIEIEKYDPPEVQVETFKVMKYSFKGGQKFVCVTKEVDDALPLGRNNGSRFKEMIHKEFDSGTDTEPLEQTDQNAVECVDERVALANLIANLKLDVDENKKIQNQLKKANTSLAHELKECKSILEESNSIRDSCLIAL
ncbi:hypothetical protein Tco_0565829 [Tanacetum coccineum]